MRLRGIGMTLHGAEGEASPPLPFVEVNDNEGAALIALYPKNVGVVGADVQREGVEFGGGNAPDAEAERLAAEWAASEAAAREAAQAEEAERQRAAAEAAAADEPPVADPAPAPADEPNPHAEMFDAIDLLEADDFVKTGPRKGKPKIDAVANILGRDVTPGEIDAAFAAKQAAE